MELTARQLALDLDPRRRALTRAPAVDRERVRLRRGVEQRRELRVRDLAVVALEEVLADDLPVRVELRLPARVVDERLDVEPELRDLRGHRAERLRERLAV